MDAAGRPIRVAIIDDHPPIHEVVGWHLTRAPGAVVVGGAGDGAAGLRLVAEHQPDVLILDVALPGEPRGVEVARRVRREFPRVAILVLSGYDTPGERAELLRLGVRGYLPKTVDGEEIAAAVRAVAAGRMVFMEEAEAAAVRQGLEPLTEREREVLRLLAAGRRNRDIADILDLSESMIERYVGRLLRKLGAESRAEAVSKAYRLGLVLLNEPER